MEETSRRWFTGRAKWLASVALVFVAFYLLAVTPLRTYLQQQHQMHQAEQRYEILADTNKSLQDRATQLQSDAEIQRLAREKYELVQPGQQAYAVMPPSPAITQPAQEQAQAQARQDNDKKGLPARVWDAVNPWN
jgi:cell division protein FtsB